MMKCLLFLALSYTLPAVRAADPVLKLDLGNGVSMELVRIEPGTFTQGSPAGEAGRGADEQQRQVKITKPFYLAKYPVTRAQWERFAQEKNYRSEAEDGISGGYGWDGQKLTQNKTYNWRNPGFTQTGGHPVTLVTWPDAQAFLKWLGTRTGRQCALPTEAQWEYACRAGTTTPWPTGSSADDWAWHRGNAGGATHPVGQKKANAWGLSDMGGQVWEWCQDWYGPWDATAVTDPLQTNDKLSDKPRRVLRGGSFIKDANSSRSAARYRNDARSRNADNGFRVMVLDQPAAPPPPVAPPAPVKPQGTTPPVSPPPPNSAPAPVKIPESTPPSVPPQIPPHSDELPPVQEKSSSGVPPWLWLVGFLVGAVILWKIIRRAFSGSSQSRPNYRQWSQGVGGAPAGPPVVRMGPDGFWITGSIPAGAPVHWRWRAGDRADEGQTPYEPGPDGLFIFTGMRPDEAHAWLASTPPPVDPSWPGARNDAYNRGLSAGLLQNQFDRDRELRRQRDRERERDEEEDRRRQRAAEDDHRRSSASSHSMHSSYPSAY